MTGPASKTPTLDTQSSRLANTPAPLGRRAAARTIDSAILIAVFIGSVTLLSAIGGPSPDGTGIVLISFGITVLCSWIYEVTATALRGQTLGKALMQVKVVRRGSTTPPGLRHALQRSLIPTILLIGFFPSYPLPFLLALITKEHRGPHDQIAGTTVIRS